MLVLRRLRSSPAQTDAATDLGTDAPADAATDSAATDSVIDAEPPPFSEKLSEMRRTPRGSRR